MVYLINKNKAFKTASQHYFNGGLRLSFFKFYYFYG